MQQKLETKIKDTMDNFTKDKLKEKTNKISISNLNKKKEKILKMKE